MVYDCQSNYSSEEKSNLLRLHTYDIYFIFALAPLALILNTVVVLVFLIYPRARKIPGDIVFATSLCSIFVVIHYLINAAYTFEYQKTINENSLLCRLDSIIFLIFLIGWYAYDISLCFYLKIGLQLKKNKLFRIMSHLFAFLSMAIIMIIAMLKSGLDLYGMCSLKAKLYFNILELSCCIFYVCAGSISLYFVNKTQVLNNKLSWIYAYILITTVFLLIFATCTTLLTINCISWLNEYMEYLKSVHNFFYMLLPICQSICRLSDPCILSKIKSVYNRDRIESKDSLVVQLSQDYRYIQIQSLLIGICLIDINLNTDSIEDKQTITITLNNQSVEPYYPNYKYIQSKVTYYFRDHFNQIHQHQSLLESFDLIANQKKLDQLSQPSGGKSGEFFFFTHDNNYILKTINEIELKAYSKRKDVYFLNYKVFAVHFTQYPNSFINKIQAIYNFEFLNGQSIYLMILQNIAKYIFTLFRVNNERILKSYDLKGSNYDRQSIKKTQEQKFNNTLKDLDFQNIEKYIQLQPQQIESIQSQLDIDSNFLKNQKLIDYSLILFYIDYSKLEPNQALNLTHFHFSINVHSSIYIHIGIIDYLQEWNLKKNVEQKSKKLINLNSKLDTSAQEPQFYASRFQQKVVHKIFQQKFKREIQNIIIPQNQ